MSNESNPTIQVSKSFDISKEKLYKAWTEPEELKQWWKPMDKQLTKVENEITEGGTVRYQFEDNLQVRGEYKEVTPGEKLVYSWIWEVPEESLHKGEYLLTVAFKDEGDGKSSLDISQQNIMEEHAVKPHQTGWDEALEDLKNYLASAKA
jgi:uncharacterized protein YndB with AHSA1/START domain